MGSRGTLTVLYFPVGKDHELVTIPDRLEEMQRLVGGYIESFHLFADVTLICNEDGRRDGLPPNRTVKGETIVGNFFVTGVAGEDFVDLTEDQIQQVLNLWKCLYCTEEIVSGEPVWAMTGNYHRECVIRAIAGSAAHQLHECSCYGGEREDPPGMTRRQAAKLAYETFVLLGGKAGQ